MLDLLIRMMKGQNRKACVFLHLTICEIPRGFFDVRRITDGATASMGGREPSYRRKVRERREESLFEQEEAEIAEIGAQRRTP